MANDYLKSSNFGQVAGSLLAQKESLKKKETQQALLLTALIEGFNQAGRIQKENLNDSILDLKENYDMGVLDREARYEKEKENRTLYENYIKNPDATVKKYAINLYNNDDVILSKGINFSNKGSYTGDTKILAEELWNSKLKESKEFIETLKDNPLATSPSFVKFNQAYYNSYKAAVNQLKNDPTKKSLLAAIANKIFPKGFDERKARLQNAFDEAKAVTTVQKQSEESIESFNPNKIVFTNKKEAEKFVEEEYSESLSIDKTEHIINQINKLPENVEITKNKIISIAIADEILNPNNLSLVEKEIKKAKELFNEKYKLENKVIPTNTDSEDYKIYKENLDNYILTNTLETNENALKINQFIELSNSDNETLQKIGKAKLLSLSTDDVTTSFLAALTLDITSAEGQALAQDAIDEEVKKENPEYRDLTEYTQYRIKVFRDIIDNIKQ
tara:strand:- start:197 stop:1537 length:1341 start_codon:yes stop_codon:yes gene_type:complete